MYTTDIVTECSGLCSHYAFSQTYTFKDQKIEETYTVTYAQVSFVQMYAKIVSLLMRVVLHFLKSKRKLIQVLIMGLNTKCF